VVEIKYLILSILFGIKLEVKGKYLLYLSFSILEPPFEYPLMEMRRGH
jgi:hypothetical protein